MAMNINTSFRWPDADALDPNQADPWYDPIIDLLEFRFTQETIPRVEVPLETSEPWYPSASVQMDAEDNLTGDVVGLMIEHFSDSWVAHPEWRQLAIGHVSRETLRTLIEALSPLVPESD